MKNPSLGTVHVGVDAVAMGEAIAEQLARPLADPFARPLVLTRGAAVNRWLSQVVATTAADGEGICAGLEFAPVPALEALLAGTDDADDAWSSQRLAFHILDLAAASVSGLEPVSRAVSGSRDAWLNALRIGRLMRRYADHRPGLVARWANAREVGELGLGPDAWQARLWRALAERIGTPDPAARRVALAERIREGTTPVPWPRVVSVFPTRLTESDADLLAAVAARVPLDVWHLCAPRPGHPLEARLGRRAREVLEVLAAAGFGVHEVASGSPSGLLGRLSAEVAAGRDPGPADPGVPAVSVHASHGLGRQVEVLRDALAGLMEADPTLEPRHIVIATPRPADLLPHIEAAFRSDDPDAASRHPGYTFRVQAGQPVASEANTLHHLLRNAAGLGRGRATVHDLLALCAHPMVARRFGWASDTLEDLTTLIERAGVRWGLDEPHRRSFGVRYGQSTWALGVQRLMLGVALGDDQVAAVGTVSPVDDVDSSLAGPVGALTELVGRLRRISAACARPHTAAGWAEVFRSIVATIASVSFEESWQQAHLWSVLALLERRGEGTAREVDLADALAMLDAEFSASAPRPAFGNGSLVVADLAQVAGVPHRVVCLVGLDEASFPRRTIADGDDLLTLDPHPGDPDRGADDRQALLDAVLAARDHLVVVYQGRSALTNERYPLPAGVADLVEVTARMRGVPLDAVVEDEPLQPFAPALFAGAARSFDRAAARGAAALVGRAGRDDTRSAGRWDADWLPLAEDRAAFTLEELIALVEHPAKFLLKQRAGFSLFEAPPLPEQLPVELDALDRWAIGTRLLEGLAQGYSPADLARREWLSGTVPPGRLGDAVIQDVTADALDIRRTLERAAPGNSSWRLVDVDAGDATVIGRVELRDDRVVVARFGKVAHRHRVAAWVRALAVAAQTEAPVGALMVGTNGGFALRPVAPDAAAEHLAALVAAAQAGLRRVLPLPPRVAQYWGERLNVRREPDLGEAARLWDQDRDEVWRRLWGGGKPWKVPLRNETWGQPGARCELEALARLVWLPLVKAAS